MNIVFKYWLPVFVWLGLIFYMSSLPRPLPEMGVWNKFVSYAGHFIEYLILTILIARAFYRTTKISFYKIILFTGLIGILYAISDEIHQYYVPGRYSSVYDVLIDTLGIFAWLFFLFFKNKLYFVLSAKFSQQT